MFWWKYKEKRKVSKIDIDDDSKPEEVGANSYTYKWYQINGMVTEPLWSEILFINSFWFDAWMKLVSRFGHFVYHSFLR